MLSILEPVSSFCLNGMNIAGTVTLLAQRFLWENVRKNRSVLGLCGEVVESENWGPDVEAGKVWECCHSLCLGLK